MVCPATMPPAGSACGPCAGKCSFDDSCSANGDGQSQEMDCEGGQWSSGMFIGCRACCQSDSDCPHGLCARGTCEIYYGNGCFRDQECGTGQICAGAQICPCGAPAKCGYNEVAGKCVPADHGCCATNADCTAGQSCVAGVCKAAPPAGRCWTVANCNAGSCSMRGSGEMGGSAGFEPESGGKVCPCGSSCPVADEPGTCITPF